MMRKKRRKERIRKERHLGEDSDGGSIRSDNDEDDEDGCEDGAGTEGQQCEQRGDGKDTERQKTQELVIWTAQTGMLNL